MQELDAGKSRVVRHIRIQPLAMMVKANYALVAPVDSMVGTGTRVRQAGGGQTHRKGAHAALIVK